VVAKDLTLAVYLALKLIQAFKHRLQAGFLVCNLYSVKAYNAMLVSIQKDCHSLDKSSWIEPY